jgi:hypothetical protein
MLDDLYVVALSPEMLNCMCSAWVGFERLKMKTLRH